MSVGEPEVVENGNDQEKLLVSEVGVGEEVKEEKEKVVMVVGDAEANA